MNRLRIGIIGVGGRGICNARAVNDREDVELVGVCDINPERLAACDESGIRGGRFADYRDLLDEGLDAVCINTDNNVHAEQTIAAAQRGCHVYCEKPIALTVEDAERMVKACRDVATVVNLSMRAAPQFQFLRRLLQEQTWGKVLHIGVAHPKVSGLLCRGMGHKATMDPATWGPILMHDGVHVSELLRFLGGEVQSAFARTRSTGPDPANEELIAAVTIHEGGVTGNLLYMAMPFLPGRQYVICEEAGVWPCRENGQEFIHVERPKSEPENIPVPRRELTGDAYYVDEFIRAIREGHRPYATMEDGLAGQRIVEAIRRSGLTGEVVAL